MYLMSYFRTEAEALHLAVSEDGMHWDALNRNQPLLWGEVGSRTLRDPFILRAQDGRFHLLATDGWASDSIVHATSKDLMRWSPQELLPVMRSVPGTRNCWAPEAFWDAEACVYRLLWSSTVCHGPIVPGEPPVSDHRIWQVTTHDFRTFSQPSLSFDPGYNVIDATIVAHGGAYLMAFKDERGENRFGTEHKAIRVAVARHAEGPFAEISELVTPPLTEGPTLFRRDDEWVMFYDHFMDGYFGASASTDGRVWRSITEHVRFPAGPRHGGVLEIDEALGLRLRVVAGT
jgi:hypothetical protein